MFCVNCGTQFEGKFCPECGTKASVDPSVTTSFSTASAPEAEVKELIYLRDARDCLTMLSNEYSKILIEDIKGVKIKHTIDALMEKKESFEQDKIDLKNSYTEKLQELEEQFKEKLSLGKAALGAYTFGASLLVTGIHKKKDNEKYEALKKEYTDHFEEQTNQKNNDIKRILGEADALEYAFVREYSSNLTVIEKKVKDILNSEKWLIAKANIPSNYLNIDAVPRLTELLAYGRASTWKEACNLYEDELFKLRMVEIGERQLMVQEDILAAQQDILAAQQDLIELNMESINLQSISIELQKAGLDLQRIEVELQSSATEYQRKANENLEELLKEAVEFNKGHQVMAKEMKKIRKNTGCTKRAAQISAFTDFNDMFFGRKVKIR